MVKDVIGVANRELVECHIKTLTSLGLVPGGEAERSWRSDRGLASLFTAVLFVQSPVLSFASLLAPAPCLAKGSLCN